MTSREANVIQFVHISFGAKVNTALSVDGIEPKAKYVQIG
jgi:hypothetical protein